MLSIVMSVAQVCETLGCKERQVFYLLERGILERAQRNGKEIRIFTESVLKALQKPEEKKTRKPRVASPAGFDLQDIPLFKREG